VTLINTKYAYHQIFQGTVAQDFFAPVFSSNSSPFTCRGFLEPYLIFAISHLVIHDTPACGTPVIAIKIIKLGKFKKHEPKVFVQQIIDFDIFLDTLLL